MPMGLSNSAPVFERLMESVLSGLTWKTCLVYRDDIIIQSQEIMYIIRTSRQVTTTQYICPTGYQCYL